MKTFFKVLLILLLGNGLIFISQSCYTRCGKNAQIYRTDSIPGTAKVIVGIDSSNVPYKIYKTADYRGEAVRYDSIAFRFLASISNVAEQSYEGFNFTAVQACDPAISYDQIYAIKITSNKNYNTQHPAGVDLQDIMLASDDYNFKRVSINNSLQYINSYSNYLLSPVVPPAAIETHDLTFTFILGKGKIVVTKINKVTITK